MLIRNFSRGLGPLARQNRFYLLDHNKMQKEKESMFGDKEKTTMLKLKFLLKEAKYTLVQGCKDFYADTKWLINLYRKKTYREFSGLEIKSSRRVVADVAKFIPYFILLMIPLAEVLIPVIVWFFPNCVPSFFLFDTAEDKRIEQLQILQDQSYSILIEKLLNVLRQQMKMEEEFTNYEFFKKDFFEVIDDLNVKLNYNDFNSDELMTVLEFMGTSYMTGTNIINKIVNLFTLYIPRFTLKTFLYLRSKITKKKLEPYEDPWWIRGNFRIFKFNYFPFEYFKRKFLIYQINRNFRLIKKEDEALEEHGAEDIEGFSIREFARERGLASLSCYITLKNVVENDWVKITTHPKFTNNTKLWYSVMLYHFMKESSRDLN